MKTRFLPLGLVAALLACGTGCAKPDWIQQTLVTVDVSGTWRATEGSLIELKLEQQGAKVYGSYLIADTYGSGTPRSGTIEGTVAGDVFRFSQASGIWGLQGELTVNGDEMRVSSLGPFGETVF